MEGKVIDLSRNAVIKRIKGALKRRSGKSWSVTGGRGTAYGWISIDVPPARRRFLYDGVTPSDSCYGHGSMAERTELANLLGLSGPVHPQGHSVPSSHDYYREIIDRAEGRMPEVVGVPYWD